MKFDSEAIARLQSATGLAGVEQHEEVGSTNDLAIARVAAGHDRFPWLILADRQTAGRGRGSNRWWSSDGSLTLTLLQAFDEGRSSGSAAPRSLAVGLGLCDAVAHFLPRAEVRLKWPNDVYVNGRKICGVLTEVPVFGAPRLVIGVGLNVNNSVAGAPPELQQTAATMRDLAGRPLDPEAVLTRVLTEMLSSLRLLEESPDELQSRWANACYLTGRIVHLETPTATHVGLCLGIDSDGALLLQGERGPARYTTGIVRRIDS